MLKLAPTFLMTLYLMVSIGINGASHFCGEDLVSFSFFGMTEEMDCDEDSCCDFPEGEDDTDCCISQEFTLLLDTERTFTDAQKRSIKKFLNTPSPAVAVPHAIHRIITKGSHGSHSQMNTSPGNIPLYLRHQSLIFYG